MRIHLKNYEMDSVEEVIRKIENDLQISFNERVLSSRYSAENGIINELTITDVHFENFDVLTPLFGSVKKLEIWWGCTFDQGVLEESLNKFTVLEELSVATTSIQATNGILRMEKLKKLSIWFKLDNGVNQKNPYVLDLRALRNLEYLSLSCRSEHSDNKFIVSKIGQLKNLKELSLECNCQLESEGLDSLTQLNKLSLYEIDVRSIPDIKSLKTLSASHRYLDEFDCTGKFSALENLKIEGFKIVSLGKLSELKVLLMGAREFDLENADCFDHLPNLEELSLTYCDISVVKKIGQLKKLRMLDLSENFELVNIDELEGLEALERLNLFDNKISDIQVLNKLPNLKQVDLSCNDIEEKEVAKQLDKPEIACFMGRPHVPFIIGRRIF